VVPALPRHRHSTAKRLPLRLLAVACKRRAGGRRWSSMQPTAFVPANPSVSLIAAGCANLL
jgi:hypothetical protein